MKITTPDDKFGLYKVTYMGEDSYTIALNMADAVDGYIDEGDDPDEITQIEFIGLSYVSPGILSKLTT